MPLTGRVELDGHLTFSEALRCYYLHDRWCYLWSNWNLLIALGVVLLAAVPPRFVFPAAFAARFLPPGGVFPLVLAGVLILVLAVMPCLVVRLRSKGPDLAVNAHYLFDAAGYEVVQPNWRYRVDWTSVREIRESRSLFFFYLLPTQATIIPKRYFRDARALAAWRNLLATCAPMVPMRRNSIAGRLL
jgi:hypothetical protein